MQSSPRHKAAGLLLFFLIAAFFGNLAWPRLSSLHVRRLGESERTHDDSSGHQIVKKSASQETSARNADHGAHDTSDLKEEEVQERKIFFCSIIGVSVLVLAAGSTVAVICRSRRAQCGDYVLIPTDKMPCVEPTKDVPSEVEVISTALSSDAEPLMSLRQNSAMSLRQNSVQKRMPSNVAPLLETKGGINLGMHGNGSGNIKRSQTQRNSLRKRGWEAVSAKEVAYKKQRDKNGLVWKWVKLVLMLVLLFSYMFACLGLPRWNNGDVSCDRGFFWETHMIFFALFFVTKITELILYTCDPTIEGELDLLEFTLKYLPSFLSYADVYLDSSSIQVADACAATNEYAGILSWTMSISYAVGVVGLQWVVVLYFAVKDPSRASLAKLLHMDALASCISVPKEHERTWWYVCMARTFGEDIPQALQQAAYVYLVKCNGVMLVSLCLSCISGMRALYDRFKEDVLHSSVYERLMRLYGSEEETKIEPDDPALQSLLDRFPYLARKSHVLRPWVDECRAAFHDGKTERAEDILKRMEMELEQEENKLEAAFSLFTPEDKDWLSGVEIQKMLEFLGFPSGKQDVDDLMLLADTDEDERLCLAEFQAYVGRTGGLFKLFEIRRKALIKTRMGKISNTPLEVDEAMLRMELLSAGIGDDAQTSWTRVLDKNEFVEAARLNDCQKMALRHIRQLSQNSHEAAMPLLRERCVGLGFKDKDVWMTLAFIRELAKPILHVNLDLLMEFLEKDTHYRNQFETNSSGGCLSHGLRKEWERALFGEAYEGAEHFDRVKYGVVNVLNDVRGVLPCKMYGDSYFVLKNVRLRCTCAPEDSSTCTAQSLAVLDYYGHVLNAFNDAELRETIRAATSDVEVQGDSRALGEYKELQIHGEVDLSKHVQMLVANERHRDNPAMAERIKAVCAKHGIELTWMDVEVDEARRTLSSLTWQDPAAHEG